MHVKETHVHDHDTVILLPPPQPQSACTFSTNAKMGTYAVGYLLDMMFECHHIKELGHLSYAMTCCGQNNWHSICDRESDSSSQSHAD